MKLSRRAFVASSALVFAPEAFADAQPTVLLVGDSHVFMMERFCRAEAKRHRIAAEVIPHGGSSVRQWLRKHWLEIALRKYASVEEVLICLGTNCTRAERPKLVDDIRSLVFSANASDSDDPGAGRATWLLPPPLKVDTSYLNRAVAQAEVFGLSPGRLPLSSDGIHLTPDGYADWAQRIAEIEWE